MTDVLFEEDPPREVLPEGEHDADALLLNIDGFEGPIDVLLNLARDQKVDLTKVSILQLARQYLTFIDRAQELRLDLAAEYLVMAAWLAYLKSRLLLPKENDGEEVDAETMAEALQFQLRRLEAMQQASEELFGLPQLGQDIFPRGMPEGLTTKMDTTYDASLYDLLKSYGDIERRQEFTNYELPTFSLMSMEVAMQRMTKMLGKLPRKGPWSVWTTLTSFIPEGVKDKLYVRSAMASCFTVGLELAKQGKVEIKQDGLFRPIYLRAAVDRLEDDYTEDETGQDNAQSEDTAEVEHDTGT
ncbi:MAG TPA: segregation/condensation protein A [Micavibrio sp.]|nr:segregation/condensation protein A [Micavibrio sp.]HIL29635.1 segregation/condensation protein A [Micavibrio sp.]